MKRTFVTGPEPDWAVTYEADGEVDVMTCFSCTNAAEATWEAESGLAAFPELGIEFKILKVERL